MNMSKHSIIQITGDVKLSLKLHNGWIILSLKETYPCFTFKNIQNGMHSSNILIN